MQTVSTFASPKTEFCTGFMLGVGPEHSPGAGVGPLLEKRPSRCGVCPSLGLELPRVLYEWPYDCEGKVRRGNRAPTCYCRGGNIFSALLPSFLPVPVSFPVAVPFPIPISFALQLFKLPLPSFLSHLS
ncbi:hypothetical protein JZ751_005395 [Albula glossodonta]|uniref:Uncharacterized protein n=1 Tax=Albula glossodonta TaxID=121402 RepID=A0A8T2N9D6_9TELE|nr:hypothetical protein JZ751_005395 [Albula glossodonta]